MSHSIRKTLALLLCVVFCLTLVPPVWAQELAAEERVALGSGGGGEPGLEEGGEPDGYARLLEAIQNEETNVSLDGMGIIRIQNDLVIPAGMFVSAWGGSAIEVPEGVTLSVNGELHADGFILNGTLNVGENTFVNMGALYGLYNGHPLGTLIVGYRSSVDMRGEYYDGFVSEALDGSQLSGWIINNIVEGGRVLLSYDAWDDDSLAWAYEQATSLAESFVGRVNVNYDAEISENADPNRDHVELFVDGAWGNKAALTIAQGVTVSAAYMCVQNTTLTVNGKLINNDRIDLRAEQDGENGTVSRLPRLIVNGELIGPGMFYVYGIEDEQTARGCIQGLGELNGYRDGDAWVFYSGDSLFEALEAACNAPITDHLSLRYLDGFTIQRSITIPERLYVDAKGTILTVPNGVTVTVQGGVKTRAFDIQEGGTVILDGGHLELRETQHDDFPVNGALVLENTTVDIPAPVWGEWCNNGQRDNITFNGDNALIRAMFEPAPDNIAKTFNRANLTVEPHVMPVIDVRIPIELPEDITVNQGVRLKVHEDITVPAGRTLSLSSNTSMQDDSRLIVSGTLENNSFLEFTPTLDPANNPRLSVEAGGVYTGRGTLAPQAHEDADDYFSGVDLSGYGRAEDNIGTRYIPSGVFYHNLKEACESANPPRNMNFINLGTITIEDNLTIPAGMYVNAEGTGILVPQGVTLTVNGTLFAKELTVNGSVKFANAAYEPGMEPSTILNPPVLGEGASVTAAKWGEVRVMYPAFDAQSLRNAAQNAAADAITNVSNNVLAMSDITIPAGTDIPLNEIGLIVAKNGKLTLENNGTITANNARIIVNGRLENFGSISMSFGSGFDMPHLLINGMSGGVYAGGGSITFYDSEEHIEGLNLDAFSVTRLTRPTRWVYRLNTDFAFEELQDMAATAAENQEYYELDLKDLGEVRINESVVIPPNMHVNAENDQIVVPQGVVLTINGGLRTNNLRIEEGGKVAVNGYLEAYNRINAEGELEINRTWVRLNVTGVDSLDWENIRLNGDAGFIAIYNTNNDNEFISAMNDIQGHQVIPNVRPVVRVHFDMAVGSGHEIANGVQVTVTDGKTFTIPTDAVLTVNGTVHAMEDAKIIVNGTLVNNGTVDTDARKDAEDTSPRLIFAQGSSYEGRGYLGVMDNNDPESYISGLDVSGFQTLVDNVGIRYYQAGDVWGELLDAIDNGENYYYMGNLGELTMPYDISLPANFSIETWGTTIIVPRNRTLTIEPGARIGIHNLNVQSRGKVVVADNGYLNVYTSLVLNGSMTAGNNARLHLASQTGDTAFLNRITLNNARGATIHFYPSDETQLLNAKAAADALPDPYEGNIHVRFPWTLSTPISFDGKTSLEVEASGGYTGSLTIADGGELTLNNYSQIRSTVLTIGAGGRLINNAELAIHKNDRFPTGTLALEEGGSYEGRGAILVFDTSEEEAPDHITGIEGLVGLRTVRDGEEITAFRPDAFQGLKQAVESGAEYYDLRGVGYVRIAEDFTIPQGMRVEAWDGTVIDVPDGVTLTINGEIYADGLILNGGIELGEGVYSDLGNLYEIENQNGRPRGTLSLARDAELKLRQYDNNIGINPIFVDRWVFPQGGNARLGIDYFDTWDENNIHKAVQDARNLPDIAYGNIALQNDQWLWNLDLTNPRSVSLIIQGNWDESGWHANGVTLDGNTRTDYVSVRGSSLYINGDFENTSRIELFKEQDTVPHLYFNENARINGNLRIYVYDAESEEAARACVSGLDDLVCYQEGDAWVFTEDMFSKFKAACEDGETDYFDLTNLGRMLIEEDLTIPERLHVDAWGTVIDIPADVALTVNSNFHPDGFLLNGTLNIGDETDVGMGTLYGIENGRPAGTLNVGYHCHVDIQGMGYDPDDVLVYLDSAKLSDWAHKNGERGRILLSYNAYENGDFEGLYPIAAALPDPFVGRVCIGYPYALQDNLNANEDAVELIVDNGGSLTVPAGKTLIARYMGNNGGNLIVNGTLVNTDRIALYPEDGSIPAITVAEGGKLIGSGEIDVHAQTLEEARTWLIGFTNLTDGEWNDDEEAWAFYTSDDAFELLALACEQELTDYLDLRRQGDVTILRDITIPARLAVEAGNIIVPDGVTLTVEGYLRVGGLAIAQTGKVIDNGGYLGVFDGNPEMLIIDGSLEVRNVWFEMQAYFWDHSLDDTEKSHIRYQGYAGINVVFFRDGAGAEDAIAQASQLTTERVHGIVNVNYDFTLSDDLTIPGGVVVVANNRFTVPAGKTLTVDGRLNIRQNGVLDVFGTLVNNSFVEYKPDSAGAAGTRLILEDGAAYTGFGEIAVRLPAVPESSIGGLDLENDFDWFDDEIGTHFRLRPVIDLMLPAMLTEIESEAFAGGAFRSVYIPESVTVIADDAFGDMQGLTIFGETETARSFAESHSYIFVEYSPAA